VGGYSTLSLSIRRFWGKRGSQRSEKGRGRKERNFLSLLPLPLLASPLLSPSPLGRPDTQASPH